MSLDLTKDQLRQAVPVKLKGAVTDEMVERLNKLSVDQDLRESFRDNLLGYTGVLNDGRYKMEDYINAVKYVSYKLLGSTNADAYARTFPDRWQGLVDRGADSKVISAYTSAYNKNKLVNIILEQSMVPTHVLNMDVYQEAINVQAELMRTAHSEKVRSDAANSLLTHLKPPETSKIKIDIATGEDKIIDALRATTQALVEQQRRGITSGDFTVAQIAESKLKITQDNDDVIDITPEKDS